MKKIADKIMRETDAAIEALPLKQKLAVLDALEEYAFLRGYELENGKKRRP